MAKTETPRGAWRIAFLLLCYMLVNFADKIVVGLAGVPIKTDLGLTQTEFGFLGSSFFFLFSISAIAFGFLVNTVPTRWVLFGLAAVWAFSQFPMVSTVSYSTLVICRIILGAGEGPAYSVAVHALYKWFPDEKRALPTAILAQGSALGVVFAVPALNWLIVNKNWHWAFGALGVVGLLWLAAWAIWGSEGPLSDTHSAADGSAVRVPYSKLMTCSTFLGCIATSFGAYWALSLGLTWFTPFLVEGLGFEQKTAGFISVLPWVLGALIVLLTGIFSQMLTTRGVGTRLSRGVLGSVPLIVGGLILLAMPAVETPAARIAVLVVATGLSGSIYVVCPPMLAEFTPASQRGAIIAIYGALYTIAGLLAPTVTGKILDSAATPLAGYLTGFRVLAIILVTSGVLGLLMLRPNNERARFAKSAAGPVAAE